MKIFKRCRYTPFIIICIFSISILFSISYFISNIVACKIDINKFDFKENNNIVYSIDKFEEKRFNRILIQGWIINKNENNSRVNIKILCKNVNTGDIYEIKTFSDKRIDVTQFVNDTYNYDFSGFNSMIIKYMLPESGQYKIMILFHQNDKNFIVETPYDFYND